MMALRSVFSVLIVVAYIDVWCTHAGRNESDSTTTTPSKRITDPCCPNKYIESDDDINCVHDTSVLECKPRAKLIEKIQGLKKAIEHAKELLKTNNCTICHTHPCKNNGTCTPKGGKQYTCTCKPEYTGKNCEKKVECKPNSCGKNAECTVTNGQIHCTCIEPHFGDPELGCFDQRMRACMWGDPHYTTFDGQKFDYQGTCPYYFVKPCKPQMGYPWGRFSVKVKNEVSFNRAHVSKPGEVEAELFGHNFHVDKTLQLYVDGSKENIPYFFPNKTKPMVTVERVGEKIIIKDNRHLEVDFADDSVCVYLPIDKHFNGSDKLCGLGGNHDGDCNNDFRSLLGKIYKANNTFGKCKTGRDPSLNAYADEYIINEVYDTFLNLKPDKECLKGKVIDDPSMPCMGRRRGSYDEVKEKCKPLKDAIKGEGIFGICKVMGEEALEQQYENCVFDDCQQYGLRCNAFKSFVKLCQTRVPNKIIEWRVQTECPAMDCPAHSTYSPCAPGCPKTCASPNKTNVCTKPCVEGCVCDEDYVNDGDRCVIPKDCGCFDKDGNYHSPQEVWYTKNCTMKNECEGLKLRSEPKLCHADAVCLSDKTTDFKAKCVCKKGFKGDGYRCRDIDECKDKRICNANKDHGVCINDQGGHTCKCYPYFNGSNCEHYYPSRSCGDLRMYHGIVKSGVYEIKPERSNFDKQPYTPIKVYCDMETAENGQAGGWTLMSSANQPDFMSQKGMNDYKKGFGDLDSDPFSVWLGLDVLNSITAITPTSLRVEIHLCGTDKGKEMGFYCTYPRFLVYSKNSNYLMRLEKDCVGNVTLPREGWRRWEFDVGPKFSAMDSENNKCAKFYQNTGWWYDESTYGRHCGAANFNGVQYSCDKRPALEQMSKYAYWDHNPINWARLWIRPVDYENKLREPKKND